MSNGDFDLRIFFDGRSLLKEKTYPQNIKLEIYTLVDDDKSLVSLINRTIKNEKAAKNIFFAIKLPRIESTTELMFDIYDSHNMLNSTFAKEITIDSTGVESALESVPDFECDAEDGECLLEYMLRHVTFSANYDRNLKTHVYKNDKGRYFVNIPIKKGRKLKKNVKGFNVSGGSGKASGKNNSNFLDGYPFYEDGEEVSLAFWNDLRDAIQFSFKDSSNFMRFDKSGSLQLSTNLDKGFLNIAAGSSTKAPIVLNQGALLDTLTEGAIEYDGNNLYFTNGSSRQVIGAQGPAGPPGPAGSQGPAGPAGAPGGGGGVDLSNGGFLNGNISFIPTSMINNAVFNGSLQYRTGAVDGLVLTSDAAGNASWQSLSSLVNGGSGAISSGAAGAIQFSDGAGGFSSNGRGLVWDNVNGYALIGDADNFVVAIGQDAAMNNTSLNINAIGRSAAFENEGASVNAIGVFAAQSNNGSIVNAIGAAAAFHNTGQRVDALGLSAAAYNTGSDVVAIGNEAAQYNDGSFVVALGEEAAQYNSGNFNVMLGKEAALVNNGDYVISIGQRTLLENNGDFNIAIGYQAGRNTRNGSENIMIGRYADVADPNSSKQINIGNTIYGGNGKLALGIVKVDAAATLELNGSFQYTDGNEAAGFVLTADNAGQATWQSLSSLVNGGSGAISNGAVGAIQFSDGAGGFRDHPDFVLNTNGYALIGDSTRSAVQVGNLAGVNSKGSSSIYLGLASGINSNGDINTFIGRMAGFNSTADRTIALGFQSAQANTGYGVISLGELTASSNFGNGVIAIGNVAAGANTGHGIIALGPNSLYGNNGDYSIAIGDRAGHGDIKGDRDILIGYQAQPASITLNGQLNIGDTIYGNQDTKSIAINKVDATPDANLVVNGSFQYTDGNEATGFVLTSDALGQASWQSLTGTNGSANYWNIDSNILSNTGASADETVDDFVFGSPSLNNDGNSNHGNRFFFNKSTGALRSGRADDDAWNGINLGQYSLAFGHNSQAAGQSSMAFGNGVTANGNYSMAFGENRSTGRFVASGENAILRGLNIGAGVVEAAGDYSTVVGQAFASGSVRATNGFDSVKGVTYGGDIIANGGLSHAEGYVTWNATDRIEAGGIMSNAKGVAQFGASIVSEGMLSSATGYTSSGSSIYTRGHMAKAESYLTRRTSANGTFAYASGAIESNFLYPYSIISAIGNGSFARGITYLGPIKAKGTMAHALGDAVFANGDMSFVIGRGLDNADMLISNQGNSLTIGFNSNAATLFVGPSAGGSNTGNVGIGTSSPATKLDVHGEITSSGGLDYDTNIARPVCDVSNRGLTWFTESGGGVKDEFAVCAKDAGDAYAWRVLY